MADLIPSGVPAPFETLGLTFDDMLFQPNESNVIPSEAATRTWFSRSIRLNTSLSLVAIDIVVETRMVIAVVREDSIDILHRNLPIDDQTHMMGQVKRSETGMAAQPVTIGPGASLQEVDEVRAQYRVSGPPVVDDDGMLLGIITNRDLRFEDNGTRLVSEVTTKMPLVTAPIGIFNDDALALLAKNKTEKLPIVDSWGRLKNLITLKNFIKADKYPDAARDDAGRLRVGAAVGFFDDAWERAMALVEQGVGCIIVDTTHGHPRGTVDMIRRIKADPVAAGVDVIDDNVATCARARALVEAGANGMKIDVGPGSVCTTHVVAGVGVSQVTAIRDAARAARSHGVPVIGDGGLQYSDGIAKVTAAEANSVMLRSLLVGCEESPDDLVFINGKQFKTHWGVDSLGTMAVRGRKAPYSKDRYFQSDATSDDRFTPEGIEGQVAYHDPLAMVAYQLVGGFRQSIFHFRIRTIGELQERGRFVRTIAAGPRESYSYDIQLTAEAPSY